MSGNGAGIITKCIRQAFLKIRQDQYPEKTACCGAARGINLKVGVVLSFAAGILGMSGSITSVSVWPGTKIPDALSVFTIAVRLSRSCMPERCSGGAMVRTPTMAKRGLISSKNI